MSDPSPVPQPAEGQAEVGAEIVPRPAEHAEHAEVAESETDRIAAQITGAEDHVGLATLWRLTMGLDHWWFIAVGEPGQESPAAADVDGKALLLAFTSAERARHFAVQQEMIEPDETLSAIALSPHEVVDGSAGYAGAQIDGLMFDAHLSGYFIPCDQLPVVWDAVMAEGTPTAEPEGAPGVDGVPEAGQAPPDVSGR